MTTEHKKIHPEFFNEVGQSLGFPELEPDDLGSCTFLIDEKIEVNLQREEDGSALIHACVGTLIPERRNQEVLEKLLESNLFYFWREAEAETLSLDPASGMIFLAKRIPAARVRADLLEKSFDGFMTTAEYWIKKIEGCQ